MDISEFKRSYISNRHPWELARARVIEQLLNENAPNINYILDVGSGDAYVLKELIGRGIGNHHTAVDTAFSEEIVAAIRGLDSNDITFLKSLPSTLKPRPDVILLLDVLEHCQEDNELLKKLMTISAEPETTFLITVPAFQSLFSKHDLLLNHYRRYSVHELKKLCRNNNLEVITSGYFFFSLLVIRFIQLFLETVSLRKPSKSIDNWNRGPFVTKLLSSILWIDFKLGKALSRFHLNLPGLSAYCICRPLLS